MRGTLSAKTLRRLRRFVNGETQLAIARDEGVSSTSVSQSIRMGVSYAIRAARPDDPLPHGASWTRDMNGRPYVALRVHDRSVAVWAAQVIEAENNRCACCGRPF